MGSSGHRPIWGYINEGQNDVTVRVNPIRVWGSGSKGPGSGGRGPGSKGPGSVSQGVFWVLTATLTTTDHCKVPHMLLPVMTDADQTVWVLSGSHIDSRSTCHSVHGSQMTIS